MTMNNIYYAGIGSRETPKDVLYILFDEAQLLAKRGLILRSGGANGADVYFEGGCDSVKGKKEIYLPWKNYNNNKSEKYNVSQNSIDLSMKYHPNPSACKFSVRLLHGRNVNIMLGSDLKRPVSFVLCWTKKTGGTQQSIRIANDYNIPVFNLYNENDIIKYVNFLIDNSIITENEAKGRNINDIQTKKD